jgi:hypothetical protein
VDNPSAKRIAKARGPCHAQVFLEQHLSFDADSAPHERHANVIGWAGIPKHKLKNIQQRIAGAMALELRPHP